MSMILKPVSKDGKITLPQKTQKKYKIKEYVEIVEWKENIVVKPHD